MWLVCVRKTTRVTSLLLLGFLACVCQHVLHHLLQLSREPNNVDGVSVKLRWVHGYQRRLVAIHIPKLIKRYRFGDPAD